MLPRNTEWRQGSVLTLDSSYEFGLFEKTISDKCIVVISHDCDLPNENEEHVEVILGLIVASAEPSYSHAKNIRRLHLTYANNQSSLPVYIELTHPQRRLISKTQFARNARLDTQLVLPPEEKRVLKQWLAARYGRPAFPNAFEDRLRKDKKFEQKLADKLKPYENHLIGIFFDLGEERSTELPPGTPYFLGISMVYNAEGGSISREEVEQCASSITALFHNTFGPPHTATEIALESCLAIADTHFSAADIRKVDQWRVDYISLRKNPLGSFLAAGQTTA